MADSSAATTHTYENHIIHAADKPMDSSMNRRANSKVGPFTGKSAVISPMLAMADLVYIKLAWARKVGRGGDGGRAGRQVRTT